MTYNGTNLANVDVALVYGVEDQLAHTLVLHSQKRRLKQRLRAPESLGTQCYNLAVGQRVLLLDVWAVRGALHLCGAIKRDVAQPFLDVAHDLLFRAGGERVPALGYQLSHVRREVAAGKVEAADGVRHAVAFVDRHLRRGESGDKATLVVSALQQGKGGGGAAYSVRHTVAGV